MTKGDLGRRLQRLDTSFAQAARDLGVRYSTAMRWRTSGVPGYAEAYVLALEVMTPEQRAWLREVLHAARQGA